MRKKVEMIEHQDLEEKFQLSTEIEFSFNENDFNGLYPMEISMKGKKKKKIEISNVELRKSTNGLF